MSGNVAFRSIVHAGAPAGAKAATPLVRAFDKVTDLIANVRQGQLQPDDVVQVTGKLVLEGTPSRAFTLSDGVKDVRPIFGGHVLPMGDYVEISLEGSVGSKSLVDFVNENRSTNPDMAIATFRGTTEVQRGVTYLRPVAVPTSPLS
ncbi:MAG: hypothetical protein JWO69_1845 [Thermoleophilia bacterium]|nr:hypothetical protein [Thermoleophilia bacterium]